MPNWQVIVDDTFRRANTTPGVAGSSTGVGNSWIDQTGGIWSIQSNQATTTSFSGLQFYQLTRPSSENQQDSRIIWEVPVGLEFHSQPQGIVRRIGPQSMYLAYISSSGAAVISSYNFGYNALASGGTGNLSGWPTSGVTTKPYRFELTAEGVLPTVLTFKAWDISDPTNPVSVLSISGSDNDSRMQAAGSCGIAGSAYGGSNISIPISKTSTYQAISGGPTPGIVSIGSIIGTTVVLSLTTPSGGVSPYSYQLQRAADVSGSPGPYSNVGSLLVGQTGSATFVDASGVSATPYWYRVAVTDAGSITRNSDAISLSTGSVAALLSVSGPNLASVIPANHNGNITLTLTGSGTSWTAGTIFSVSGLAGIAKFSQTVSNTTSASVVVSLPSILGVAAPGVTGTLSISDGQYTGTIVVAAPSLAVSPATGLAQATTGITLTGTNTLWQTDTPGFTISGTGNSLTGTGVNSNLAASRVVAASGLAGAYAITDPSTGASATFTTASGPVTVSVADSNWFFSPYNWVKNGSNYVQTNTPGAYFKVRFSGTSLKMNVDVSALTLASVASSLYPTISYSIDGGSWTRYQLAPTDIQISLATSLAAATHSIELYFVGGNWTTDRWTTPTMALRISGLVIDSGAATLAPNLRPGRAIIYGDSHLEGYELLAVTTTVSNSDAQQSWGSLLGRALGCEYGIVGFAGQGYAQGGGGNVPALASAWNSYWNGQTRLSSGLFSPAPDYIISGHGTNDLIIPSSTVISLISSWRAAGGANAKILICNPPGQTGNTAVSVGVTAASDPKAYWIDQGEDLTSANVGGSYRNGNVHLSLRGHVRYGSTLAVGIVTAISGTPTVNPVPAIGQSPFIRGF